MRAKGDVQLKMLSAPSCFRRGSSKSIPLVSLPSTSSAHVLMYKIFQNVQNSYFVYW